MTRSRSPPPLRRDVNCDVLVVGGGAAGMSAAIAARLLGLTVVLAEKHHQLGGSTARSGGNLWVPCNPLALAGGICDSLEEAREYIKAEAGRLFDAGRADAFLRNGPVMVKTYSEHTTAVRFVRADAVSDTHPHLPGAKTSGRTLTVPPFSAGELGAYRNRLAPPLPELTFLGMQVRPGRELQHFFDWYRDPLATIAVTKRLLRHAQDVLVHGQATLLANGNALAARLLRSCLDLHVDIRFSSPVTEIEQHEGGAWSAILEQPDGRSRITARLALILATGGFPHDPARRKYASPVGALGAGAYALGAETNVGDGLTLAESAGGVFTADLPNSISWTPVSRVPRKDGSYGLFPHGPDREKPGLIAVTCEGRRFADETVVGNDFIRAMVAACGARPTEGFFIFDHATLRRHGIGVVRPWPAPIGKHLRSGYLMRGSSLEELARIAGIDAAALVATVQQFNHFARIGKDLEFGREIPGNQTIGVPGHTPRGRILKPLERAPFYAIRIFPGDFSTLAGLRVDERCRVLDVNGRVIDGLYAVGNDACSLFGGNSPAGGATLGPAMTFGFIAGQDAARRASTHSHGEG